MGQEGRLTPRYSSLFDNFILTQLVGYGIIKIIRSHAPICYTIDSPPKVCVRSRGLYL
jgi:hypothetical protein